MDVLAALADNLGTNKAHLPIKEGMSLQEVLTLINGFYLEDAPLNYADYKDSQAFVGSDGRVTFELIDPESGGVLMTFVNSNSAVAARPALANPFEEVRSYTAFIFDPLTIDDKAELDFLNDIPERIPTPTYNTVNDVSFKLATLLNNYNYNGRWMTGTFGNLSTAGFEVVFKGWSIEAPDEFLLDYSSYVVILKLHEGDTRGYVCLRT